MRRIDWITFPNSLWHNVNIFRNRLLFFPKLAARFWATHKMHFHFNTLNPLNNCTVVICENGRSWICRFIVGKMLQTWQKVQKSAYLKTAISPSILNGSKWDFGLWYEVDDGERESSIKRAQFFFTFWPKFGTKIGMFWNFNISGYTERIKVRFRIRIGNRWWGTRIKH